MKRYITSMLAIILAVGFAAFTTAKKSPPTNVRFQFDNTASGESSPANWDYAPSATCANSLNNACVIEVSSDVVTPAGASFVIDPTKLQSKYGSSTLPMTTDGHGTHPTSGQAVYLLIDNKN
jgi:hypothetical protein